MNPLSNDNEIAILDFGSQYTHLIARRVRELGVRSRIYPNDIPANALKNAVGVIFSGGPKSVVKDSKLKYDPGIFNLNIPLLGLCYGHQLIAKHFGGTVESSNAREYGLSTLSISPAVAGSRSLRDSYQFPISESNKENESLHRNSLVIFKNVPPKTTVWMSHGDHVSKLPKGFKQIATSGNDSIAAMADEKKKIYGFQFHPEVHHTEAGVTMLKNFVFGICGAKKNWTAETMLQEIQAQIKKEAGDKNVFLLVSGGVDSTVCFALLEKTLGKKRVYGLHVDHGLMRLNESKEVKLALAKIGLDNLHVYNAEDEMLAKLKNVYDPEEKRKIIGKLFVEVAERVMKEQGFNEKEWLLGQGTIYPDTIESGGTKNADKIKTHHNRVDRVQEMIKKGLVIEPIKDLYKDEVREIGLKLGLPKNLINRQPFPGPGLAIRCLCAEKSSNTQTLQHANTSTFYKLPIKSVGVQGDERSYAHPALLVLPPRRGETERGLNWSQLKSFSPQITNTHKDINRVLLLISGEETKLSRATVKLAYITKKRLDLLRIIDAIVKKHASGNPRCDRIWQFPVVLIPFGHNHNESIVLRPVESKEAMTVSFAELPDDILNKIKIEIEKLDAIDYIFYDITNKPPGTIEWE
ncbi:MAG: glutamine-hydrolyzing GMP synthase [Patescibacteria group bacterium]